MDLCELPSQLMEYWVRDPATLRRLARHHRTGQPMPAGLARGAVAGLTMFNALDLQQQARLRPSAGGTLRCVTNRGSARLSVEPCGCASAEQRLVGARCAASIIETVAQARGKMKSRGAT